MSLLNLSYEKSFKNLNPICNSQYKLQITFFFILNKNKLFLIFNKLINILFFDN